MSAILIKNAPTRVHDWLRRTATQSRIMCADLIT